MKILIFSPSPTGGLAEHAHYQARAIHDLANRSVMGNEKPQVEVSILCSPDFLDGRKVVYKKEAVFGSRFSFFSRVAGRVGELADRSLKIIGEQWRLALEVLLRKPDVVLLASYSEYLAPLWVLPHWILARLFGVVYVANLHDPVRDYVVGPKCWHHLSVKMAYWPISVGVVHQRLAKPSPVPKHVNMIEAPVGVYDLQESLEDPEAIRAVWGVGRRVSPEDGRSQLGYREKEDDLTTKDTNTEGRGEEVSTTDCTDGHGYFQKMQGDAQRTCAGASKSDSLTSELADSPDSESLISSADGPDGALRARSSELEDRRLGEGGVHKSSGGEGSGSTRPEGEISCAGAKTELPVCEQGLDAGLSSRDSSSPVTLYSLPVTEPEVPSPATGFSPLGTPASPEVVFLAFGFIRDNKNLDLLIRALVENPSAVLVVMGRAQSKKDKPLEFYRNLALELGVQDRVKFFEGFVPDEKLASYFAAADVVVLTYDASFHSQSGVLNVAARAKRPVLASAGDSPLKDCVLRFRLGFFVEPDNLRAITEGMKMVASDEWRVTSGEADWVGYEAFASWNVNVAKILEGVEQVRKKRTPVE